MLPQLLDGLTVNGNVFSGESLEHLPDPLPFPALQPDLDPCG